MKNEYLWNNYEKNKQSYISKTEILFNLPLLRPVSWLVIRLLTKFSSRTDYPYFKGSISILYSYIWTTCVNGHISIPL